MVDSTPQSKEQNYGYQETMPFLIEESKSPSKQKED